MDKFIFDEIDNLVKLFFRDKGFFDCNCVNFISFFVDGKLDESVEEIDKV